MMMFELPIGEAFDSFIDFLREAGDGFFAVVRNIIDSFVTGIDSALSWPPFWVLAIIIIVIAFFRSGVGMAVFSLIGLLLVMSMDLGAETVDTLALIFAATLLALVIGIPLGILSAKFDVLDKIIRPILDFMQTMPAFVFLIPAVLFFRIGAVPAVISTIIFAMPPAIRLTNLGIRQVPEELVEAGNSFGSKWYQLLFKIQLPLAMPTILTGVNQCIMLSLSMVVIASMIGAGGLGSIVLSGVSQLKAGMSFEGGLAVVVIAIILDRLTQGKSRKK